MDYVAIKLVESYCSSDRTLFVSFGCLRYLKFCILIYLILIIVTVCYNESTYNFLSQKDKDRSDMKERQISFGQSTCCLILARRTGSTHPPIQEFSNLLLSDLVSIWPRGNQAGPPFPLSTYIYAISSKVEIERPVSPNRSSLKHACVLLQSRVRTLELLSKTRSTKQTSFLHQWIAVLFRSWCLERRLNRNYQVPVERSYIVLGEWRRLVKRSSRIGSISLLGRFRRF